MLVESLFSLWILYFTIRNRTQVCITGIEYNTLLLGEHDVGADILPNCASKQTSLPQLLGDTRLALEMKDSFFFFF